MVSLSIKPQTFKASKCCSAHSSLGRVLTVACSAVTPLVQPCWIHNFRYLQLKTTLSKSCAQLPETDDQTAISFTSIQVGCREIQSDDTQMFSVQLFCIHLAVFSKSYCCSSLTTDLTPHKNSCQLNWGHNLKVIVWTSQTTSGYVYLKLSTTYSGV